MGAARRSVRCRAALGLGRPLLVLAVAVLTWFVGNLTTMVDFATTVSFLTAPVLGYLNLKTVTSDEVAPEHRRRLADELPGRVLPPGLAHPGLLGPLAGEHQRPQAHPPTVPTSSGRTPR